MNPETETPPGEGGAGGTDATDGDSVPIVPQSAPWGNIPDALKALPQWLCWRYEDRDDKPTKVPYQARSGSGEPGSDGEGKYKAASSRPATWTDFATACEHASRFDGIGIAFAGRLCGVDLDHCRDPQTGELEPWAQEALADLNSYTEASPSGTGVHVLLFGDLPPGRRKVGDVEAYGAGSPKYFTVTGAHIPGTPTTIEDRTEEFAAFHARHLGAEEPHADAPSPRASAPVTLEDRELLEKARSAKNGAEFSRLWEGGYPEDDSAGDLALCSHLAFWTGKDRGRMDSLFRQSGRYREKWERADYRERTLGKAIANTTDTYTPGGRGAMREQQADGGEHKGEDKEPVAEILVALAEAEADLFRDPDGERFATVPVGEHYETYPILERGGGGLRDWLVRRYRELKDKTPHTTAVGQALVALVAEAGIAPVKQVGLRVAEAEGAIWLDLGNAAFEAVRVTRDGWTVTTDLPDTLRFRRPNGMRPLPRPERGAGSLLELRGFVNPAEDPGGFVLLVAWLLAALRPGYPFPVLALVGEQGTGKSTLARILRLLVDPSGDGGVGLTRPPRDDRDLFAIAGNTHVIALDNLTSIPPELSDSLSALATGAGLQARRLYSDADLTATYARRPIIVNGIGTSGSDIAARPDLLDRAICVPLAPVPDSRRAQEADLWPEVQRIAPGVLADLLDAVSLALRRRPGLQLPPLPRMADFAAWVISAEPALPWEEGTFLRVYAENRQAVTGDLLEADPIAPHLQRLAEEGWTGTPSDLLRALENMTSEGERKRTSWPGTAARLGRHLTRIAPALRNAGVEVRRERDSSSDRGKRIALRVS